MKCVSIIHIISLLNSMDQDRFNVSLGDPIVESVMTTTSGSHLRFPKSLLSNSWEGGCRRKSTRSVVRARETSQRRREDTRFDLLELIS